jgi:signal transduction histidine kinase
MLIDSVIISGDTPMNEIDTIQDLTIFLVDDDESIRRSLEFCFRRRKVPFFSFGTAEEALRQIRERKASLIITDYSLPGLNGLQFVRELNGLDPGLLKILITAYGNLDIAIEAMRLGVHDFIQKPFNTETIESSIHALIERAKHGSSGVFVNGRSLAESDNLVWRERLELAVAQSSPKISDCLYGIMGNVELGLLTTSSQDPLHESLEQIVHDAKQASLINNGLMSLCRESTEHNEKTDINEVARESVARFQHARRRGIEILFAGHAAPLMIEAPRTYLEDIVENLLVNSIQELLDVDNPTKKIVIAVERSATDTSIVVSDNGKGIEPALLEKLTQEGFTTKPNGHGLGLYIVRKLAEKLGASLFIRSKPGEGAEVEVKFPC